MSNELMEVLTNDCGLARELHAVTCTDEITVAEILADALGEYFSYRRDIIADIRKRRGQKWQPSARAETLDAIRGSHHGRNGEAKIRQAAIARGTAATETAGGQDATESASVRPQIGA